MRIRHALRFCERSYFYLTVGTNSTFRPPCQCDRIPTQLGSLILARQSLLLQFALGERLPITSQQPGNRWRRAMTTRRATRTDNPLIMAPGVKLMRPPPLARGWWPRSEPKSILIQPFDDDMHSIAALFFEPLICLRPDFYRHRQLPRRTTTCSSFVASQVSRVSGVCR